MCAWWYNKLVTRFVSWFFRIFQELGRYSYTSRCAWSLCMSDISDIVGDYTALGRAHQRGLSPHEECELRAWSHPNIVENDGSIWRDRDASTHACRDTERYFQETLDSFNGGVEYKEEHGALGVYVSGEPVGLVKRQESELLLATATVPRESGGYTLIRGSVYQTAGVSFGGRRSGRVRGGIGVNPERLVDERLLKFALPGSSIEEFVGIAEEVVREVST